MDVSCMSKERRGQPQLRGCALTVQINLSERGDNTPLSLHTCGHNGKVGILSCRLTA